MAAKPEIRTEQEIWTEKIIPPGYRACSFATFNGGTSIVKALRQYAASWPPGDILLSGPCGSGKTHLAISILREQIQSGHWLSVWFVSATDLLLEIKKTFEPESAWSESEVIDKYTEIEFLVIDDLGAEYVSEWVIATFYQILDRRFREAIPTLITTNLSIQEIEQRFGARIASRLSGYRLIGIQGSDYRKRAPGR